MHLEKQMTMIWKENFGRAAETLAEVWSSVLIDNYPVHAEYVQPAELTPLPEPDAAWVATHVRQSQYSLIIVKCDVSSCCRPWRSSWKKYFPQHFLPGPIVLSHDADGIGIPDPDTARSIPKPYFSSLAQRLGYVSQRFQRMVPSTCIVRPFQMQRSRSEPATFAEFVTHHRQACNATKQCILVLWIIQRNLFQLKTLVIIMKTLNTMMYQVQRLQLKRTRFLRIYLSLEICLTGSSRHLSQIEKLTHKKKFM